MRGPGKDYAGRDAELGGNDVNHTIQHRQAFERAKAHAAATGKPAAVDSVMVKGAGQDYENMALGDLFDLSGLSGNEFAKLADEHYRADTEEFKLVMRAALIEIIRGRG